MFADDTSIRCTHKFIKFAKMYIQEHLDLLYPYYCKWKIVVNAAKSEFITFTRNRDRSTYMQSTIKFNGTDIPTKSSVKYLGVTLQSNMKFNEHVKNVINKAKRVKSSLWSLFGPHSSLNKMNKVTIYKLYIRSVLTYNIQNWIDISQTCMSRIQTYQNKCIRTALNLRPSTITFRQVPTQMIHAMAKVPTIHQFAKHIMQRFNNNTMQHENDLIASLYSPTLSQ